MRGSDLVAQGAAGVRVLERPERVQPGDRFHIGSCTKSMLVGPESFQQLHRDHYQQGYALGWGMVQQSWAGGTPLKYTGDNTLCYAVIWVVPARNAAIVAAANCGAESGFRACDAAVGAGPSIWRPKPVDGVPQGKANWVERSPVVFHEHRGC